MIGVDSTFFANRTIGDIYSIDDFNGIPAIYVINYVENAGIPWTGCVATAMAQVMRYWQVPNTYNYSVIPLKAYTTGWNTTAVDEAGKILWDAGKSVCMNYGCNGSGAQMDDVDDGFKNNFSYASADYLSSFSFNDLVTNIANDKPIILSGCAKRDQLSKGWWIFKYKYYYSSECHAWVCDGLYGIKLYRLNYNENSLCSSFYFYHMNWGWNGDLNGWYYWNDWSSGIIVPSPENTSLPTLINDNYQYAKHQISNIHP